MERTRAEAAAIATDGLPTEDRITRDMLEVIAELQIEEDDQHLYQLRVVDQMAGPQQLLPQLTQFQPADTPERLEAFLARLHAYPAFMAANIEILRDGAGIRTDRAAHRRRADDRPDRAAARGPDRVGDRSRRWSQVATEADRERVREVVRDVVYPADRAFLEALRGDYLAATREDPGSGRRRTASSCTGPRSAAGRRSTSIPRRSTGSASTSSNRSSWSAARSRAAAGFGDDTAAYRAALDADPTNTPRTKDELVARAHEDIDRAMSIAPRYFGVLPRAGCEVRAVEEYKEKDAPFAYYYPPSPDGSRPGIYYANGYDLPSRKYTKLATTTYPRGGARPPLPDRARDGERRT